MLPWMLYFVLVSLLFSLAGLGAERVARERRAPSRWIWVAAMALSLGVPAATTAVAVLTPARAAAVAVHARSALPRESGTPAMTAPAALGRTVTRLLSSPVLDAWLGRGWLLASTSLALVLLASSARLSRRQRGWTRTTLAGAPVYVAADLGPAVVGLLRPRIVVPRWLAELPPAQQAHVVAHERAHLQARDPQVLAAALCLLTLVPWNAPMWWQLRRLRRAAEVDCDAGVLKRGTDARFYGQTLLAVGQRQSSPPVIVAAMSESPSFLEERIALMLRKPSKSWTVSAAACAGLAASLVAIAAQIAPPAIDSTAHSNAPPGGVTPQRALVQVPAAVLDRYAGFYQYGEAAEYVTVTREGGHLVVVFPGATASPMYPESPTMFFAMDSDAQLSFRTDAGGETSAAELHQNGARTAMPRIDAAAADRLRQVLQARVGSQTPHPASEAMLRRMIAGISAGRPNLQEMNPQLGAAIGKDAPKLQVRLAQLGAVQSIQLLGVSDDGMDVYEVHHEHGASQWGIALDATGKLIGATVPL